MDAGFCECDPIDCSPLGKLKSCEACVDAGGAFCAGDVLCAPQDEIPEKASLRVGKG